MGYKSNLLEPCGCGSEAELNGSHGGTVWYAKCLGCGKVGGKFMGKSERMAQKRAAEWWNSHGRDDEEKCPRGYTAGEECCYGVTVDGDGRCREVFTLDVSHPQYPRPRRCRLAEDGAVGIGDQMAFNLDG